MEKKDIEEAINILAYVREMDTDLYSKAGKAIDTALEALKELKIYNDNQMLLLPVSVWDSVQKEHDWIPVSDRLPEAEKEVEVTIEKRSFTGERSIITSHAFFEDGKIIKNNSRYRWNFGTDLNIAEGWYEAAHYSNTNKINDFVVAWRPIGDLYSEERQ